MEKCTENKEDITEAILAFDTLYTTNHMKILKLMLPYLEPFEQKKLAIFIKWKELIFTLKFFKNYSASIYSPDFRANRKLDFNTLFPILMPYCSETEKNILSQFYELQNMMHRFEEMQQYMPMIQELMSSMSGQGDFIGSMDSSNNNNVMNMLKNMMSEEQQAMFTMFMEGGQL